MLPRVKPLGVVVLSLGVLACDDGGPEPEEQTPECVRLPGLYRTAGQPPPTTPNTSSVNQARCTFDRSALALTCESANVKLDGIETTDTLSRSTTLWASLPDFLRSRLPVGRDTALRSRTEVLFEPTCVSLLERTYNKGRLASTAVTTLEGMCLLGTNAEWRAWDARNRPTHGTVTSGTCVGQDIVRAYDDDQHVVTITQSGGTACMTATTTNTYDPDGLPQESTTVRASGTTGLLYTILETIQVCR